MLSVLKDTWVQHNHGLLILAATIWVTGSLSLFMLLQRSLEFGKIRRQQWVTIAAMTGGIGVWATHFLAILAHNGTMAMTYNIGITLFSVLEVIFFFWLALRILMTSRNTVRQIAGGLVCTAGVSVMHFTGMAALGPQSIVSYAPLPVAWALAISSIFFVGAFLLFARMRGIFQVIAPASLAILSVYTLHFAVMSATTIAVNEMTADAHGGIDRIWLICAIVAATALLVIITTTAMLLDRYLTDLRGLADATLEGLIIIREERIVESNAQFAQLLGVEQRELLGKSPSRWLIATDHQDLLAARNRPIEATLISPHTPERSFEIATHPIEYRGRDCQVMAVRELTETKTAQRKIEHMARHDALTDLPNRILLDERLTYALALARRETQHIALIALDLDRFKAINDIFGHPAGDDVLRRAGKILSNAIRSTDTVARVGGDEFIILQVGAIQPDGAQALIRRIMDDFEAEMDVARDPLAVGVSAGIAVFPYDAEDAKSLRHGADIALYRAKQSGRGTACFFDRHMDSAVRERRALEHDLRQALQHHEIYVVFQPLISSSDGKISGYEALMRWEHPERGEILPEIFIPIAEDTGAIVQLGEWILHEACRIAVNWPEHMTLAVNVSPIQFQLSNLPEIVGEILRETGFPANRLELEITEGVLMKDRDRAFNTLVHLKQHGVRVVMDDFGTGYSSLNNLQNYPFDKIKIDRSFVATMENDVAALSIIRAIVAIGRSLGLSVVAEGVETEKQHHMVIAEGCSQAQGYLYGRPERFSSYGQNLSGPHTNQIGYEV